jgi:MGT family glycosyltransferase
MARFLAYTSPAAGHLFPLVPGLLELTARGHDTRVIGPADLLDALPVDARALDPRIAEVEVTDYQGTNGADRLARALGGLMSRGELEMEDLDRAIADFAPDALLIDTNAYGALIAAERSGLPFALINPSLLAWPGRGIPPYGLGLAPMRGPLGHLRDTVLTKLVVRTYAKAMMPRLNALRAHAGLEPLASPLEHQLRPNRLFVLSGDPLEYPRVDTPAHVRFVGAQIWDPPVDVPQWLREDGDPWVLVTCSTDYQGDEALAAAAIEALRDEPVRVIVTLADAHGVGELPEAKNARIERFVPHGPVLERAAAVICHSGMGIVQKAIAARVPIVAVPFGRDQPEVSRRVAESGTGVLLKRKDLSAVRLKSAVREARALRLDRQLSGGSSAFADAASEMVTAAGLELEAHDDRSLIG